MSNQCVIGTKNQLKKSWIRAKGSIVNQLNHKCGNANCVNLEHVYDGTQAENMRDRSLHNVHSGTKLEAFTRYIENPVSINDALSSILGDL
jgi:hypothetical protein